MSAAGPGLASKVLLLGALYLSQGLPFGFFSQALPVLLRRQGIDLAAIGATALLALPWALKALWAPLVDRYGSRRFGRRKSWIVPLQLLAATLAVAVALMAPRTIGASLLALVFVSNLLAATQDIATDALAVELLDPAERGIGNGVQVAGYRLGMIFGGGLLLALFAYLGWTPTFLLFAVTLVIATAPLWRYREPPAPPPGPEGGQAPPIIVSLRDALRAPGMAPWLPLLLAFKLGEAGASAMLRPLLVDLGLSLSAISWVLGVAGFGAGLVGALLGGYGASRLGHRRALALFALLQVAGILAYVLIAALTLGRGAITALCAFEHLTSGMATAALFTSMMDRCRPGLAATDYTLQASLVVIASGLAAALSGLSAAALGYVGHFLLSALVASAAAAMVPRPRLLGSW